MIEAASVDNAGNTPQTIAVSVIISNLNRQYRTQIFCRVIFILNTFYFKLELN